MRQPIIASWQIVGNVCRVSVNVEPIRILRGLQEIRNFLSSVVIEVPVANVLIYISDNSIRLDSDVASDISPWNVIRPIESANIAINRCLENPTLMDTNIVARMTVSTPINEAGIRILQTSNAQECITWQIRYSSSKFLWYFLLLQLDFDLDLL